MTHLSVDAVGTTDSQRSAARPVQRSASDLDSLFSALDPLYPEGDWFDDPQHDADTAQDTAQDPPLTSPNNVSNTQASLLPVAFIERWLELSLSLSYHNNTPSVLELGDQQYATCCICPSVAPLVTVNALRYLHALARHFPTRILPSKVDSPLPSYLVELPEGAVYSTVRVSVSWPDEPQLSASSQKSSREQDQSPSVNVRIHLENTAQLIRLGLTGKQDSRAQQLHQIRLAQVHQDDKQGSSRRYLVANDAKDAKESEEHRLKETSKRRADYEKQNGTTDPVYSIHNNRSPSVSAQEYCLDHEQPPEARFTISNTATQDARPSSAYDNMDNTPSSENVQLCLDHDDHPSEPHLVFKPSLLLKRFQAWTETMESHDLLSMPCDGRRFSVDHDDPSLLSELGEFLSRHGLDPAAYRRLCSRHRPPSLSCSMDDQISSIPWGENTGIDYTDMPESDLSAKKDELDLLEEYCTLDESSAETISRSKQEPAAIRLPRILSWFVSSLGEASIHTTAQESSAYCPGPDFLLEDNTMDGQAGSFQATVQGTLKDIWTKLNNQQQQHLMLTLVKMLVNIWTNFDILDDSDFNDLFEPSKDAHSDDHLEPLSLQCGVEQRASSPQPLPSTPVGHVSPMSEYRQSASTHQWEGSVEQTSVKVSAAERLVHLEDEFLNRTFLDAFKDATTPSPAASCLSLDTIMSVFDDRLIAIPQEQSPPQKRRRIDTEQDGYWHDLVSHGRRTCEEGLPRTLNSGVGSSQRMTTTRAEVLDFGASQKAGSVVTLIDGDKQAGTGMRQFDFSIDDLVVAATNETYPQDGDGRSCFPHHSKCEIVGVSRWKTSGGARVLDGQTHDRSPHSTNVYQICARGSAYPLMHLFSVPDIFCPVELGGQCTVQQLHSGGIAGEFVRLLGRYSPEAGEFMTDTLQDKERALYHRWMAAWHERSPLAPKASKVRFELMRMVSRRKVAGVGLEAQREQLNPAPTLSHQDDDKREYEGMATGLNSTAPQAYRPLRPIQQGQGHVQQPSGGRVSLSVAANLKAGCSRCAEEEFEQKMRAEDQAWFNSTAQVVDKAHAQERREREQQDIRQRSAARRDQALEHLARQLGLGKQWMDQGRALGLRLDGLETTSATDGADTGTVALDDAIDSSDTGGRSKSTWILSAEEREVLRKHLFGPGD